jgi:UDP-3-O-[3-hydroxymyristoyl] glucosamine N-acyltransferase
VKIYNNSQVGSNCIIHSGTVIGSDGFGFNLDKNGNQIKVVHNGNVVIEDDVEIGSNCTIDRATLGSTIIKKGVKMDNLIQVAHNVIIGENTVIAALVGIAGSTTIGKNCMLGGQAGVSGHLTIGDRVLIQAQSGVFKNIKSDTSVMGSPAIQLMDYNKSYVHFKNLPSIIKSLEKIFKNNKDV